jgi:hypothetical protein
MQDSNAKPWLLTRRASSGPCVANGSTIVTAHEQL